MSKSKSQKKKSPKKGAINLRVVGLSIAQAVNGLRNNETRVTAEVKGLGGKVTSQTKITYPAELLAAFRGLFGSTREYTFQMHQVLDVVSSSGGSTLGFVAISPSVASYGEWSALSSLFDEVKATESRIAWMSAISLASASNVTIFLAVDEQNLNTDPASALSVFRLAGSNVFQSLLGEGGSGKHTQSHVFASRSWCDTAVPYSTSPIGGMIGCWVYGNDGLFATSTTIAHVASDTIIRLRCRA